MTARARAVPGGQLRGALRVAARERTLRARARGVHGRRALRKGRFELADGGTLLLDEVSEVSPQIQAKLLRVLQERAFERVGSSLTIGVDVRVIATSNRDLPKSVIANEFRQDLYYRLNVLPVAIPPLRERLEDVPVLAEHFIAEICQREGRTAST
jgi:transcriptional regulator with GAF, ATPase, and Fis domain